jgi:dephospho-CoA kinase
MRRIGLTGGIGSGKSTVAKRLAELGAVVIDADALAREALARGAVGFERVVARFGAEILTPNGEVDRAALGKLVFGDDQALADLNGIVHPLVAERTAALMAEAGEDDVVVYDVPLLVENGLQDGFDAVVVVQAPEPIRLERLVQRGLPEQDAKARMARQASDEQRREVATVLLDNAGDRSALIAQVDSMWRELA